ncbi:hypothetical protein [Streptomyces sp. WMMC905]|uniref:hypothetical protein n=1 Tax=Streptomyces sp. WMMC905 TaxID=3404123 RepID=UPI003B9636A6
MNEMDLKSHTRLSPELREDDRGSAVAVTGPISATPGFAAGVGIFGAVTLAAAGLAVHVAG